jgi:hypothetical protein
MVFNQKELKTKIKTNQEEIKVMMKACLEIWRLAFRS